MSLRQRLGVSAVDQAVLSVNSLAAVALGPLFMTGEEFGLFAVGVVIATAVMTVSRGVGPIVNSIDDRSELVRMTSTQATTHLALLQVGLASTLGLVVAAGLGLLGVIGVWYAMTLWLGCAVLGLHDSLRYRAYNGRRPTDSLGINLVWLGVTITALVALRVLAGTTGAPLFGTLYLSGALFALVSCGALRGLRGQFGVRTLLSVLRAHARGATRVSSEMLLVALPSVSTSLSIAAFSGAQTAGGFRLLGTLGSPGRIVATGLSASIQPEIGVYRHSRASAAKLCARVGALITAGYLAVFAFLWLVEDQLTRLYGDLWETASPLLWPMAVLLTAAALSIVVAPYLRSFGLYWVVYFHRIAGLIAAIGMPVMVLNMGTLIAVSVLAVVEAAGVSLSVILIAIDSRRETSSLGSTAPRSTRPPGR